MTIELAFLLTVIAAAFVSWPLLRPRAEGDRTVSAPTDPAAELDAELSLDGAAGRIPLGELESLRERAARPPAAED